MTEPMQEPLTEEFLAKWQDIQKHGYDRGWLGIGWAAWQAARATTEQSLEASAICQRRASEALSNPAISADSRTAVHAALVCAAAEIAAIESRAAEQRADAWISVDERLPKACTEVLVWRVDSGPFIAQLVAPCDVPDADDESDDLRWLADAYGWQEGSEKPTHWQSLPQGPIVESQRSGDGS
jgi:hypothetical protein